MQNFMQIPNLKSEMGAAIQIFGVFATFLIYACCYASWTLAQHYPLQIEGPHRSLTFNFFQARTSSGE